MRSFLPSCISSSASSAPSVSLLAADRRAGLREPEWRARRQPQLRCINAHQAATSLVDAAQERVRLLARARMRGGGRAELQNALSAEQLQQLRQWCAAPSRSPQAGGPPSSVEPTRHSKLEKLRSFRDRSKSHDDAVDKSL
eukprot:7387441-Prymnesium_polylepis.1